MVNEIELDDISAIVVDSDVIEMRKEGDKLILSTRLSPEIIDSNFHELEEMMHKMETKTNDLSLSVSKHENRINILNEVIKHK